MRVRREGIIAGYRHLRVAFPVRVENHVVKVWLKSKAWRSREKRNVLKIIVAKSLQNVGRNTKQCLFQTTGLKVQSKKKKRKERKNIVTTLSCMSIERLFLKKRRVTDKQTKLNTAR